MKEQEINSFLNQKEYKEKKIVLQSSPSTIFIQIDGPCNYNCRFCSRPDKYPFFNLEEYKKKFEEKLFPFLNHAQMLAITGSGEFLFLPDAREILNYFNGNFPHVEKMFATNGTSLTPELTNIILNSNNKYIIHFSLHASNHFYHNLMVRADYFNLVLENLKYLLKNKTHKIKVNFIFLVTLLNLSNLPEFVKFAKEFGADEVKVYYNYIYKLEQKPISCYFAQDLTNEIFDKAKGTANECDIKLTLPPKFKQQSYPSRRICFEAWSNMMINFEGYVISCDFAPECRENILKKDFFSCWNGEYYQKLRKKLIEGKESCLKYCFRWNPGSVNDFRAHLIMRGKGKEELKLFEEGT